MTAILLKWDTRQELPAALTTHTHTEWTGRQIEGNTAHHGCMRWPALTSNHTSASFSSGFPTSSDSAASRDILRISFKLCSKWYQKKKSSAKLMESIYFVKSKMVWKQKFRWILCFSLSATAFLKMHLVWQTQWSNSQSASCSLPSVLGLSVWIMFSVCVVFF